MNNSSQEPIFTITLNEDEQLKLDDIMINYETSAIFQNITSSDTVTLTSPSNIGSIYTSADTVTLGSITDFTTFTNFYKEEFDGRFPDYEKVMDMCKEYPGLEIAYKKFKEVYKLVKDDFEGKQRELGAK